MKPAQFSLLTDENIDAAVVEFLRGEGFNVRDVKEDGLIGWEDHALLQLAVTTGKPYIGIIYLRPGHIKTEFTIGTLRTFLAQDPDLKPPLIVVAARTGHQVRVRIRQEQDLERA